MKKRKTLAMGLAVAMAVSCLAGCGGDDKKASSDGKTEQVLNISNNSVVVGLNPLINTTGPDNAAFNMVLDPLVKRVTRDGNTYEIIPAAAERKWSDGTKVTANDFEFTFPVNKAMYEELGSDYATSLTRSIARSFRNQVLQFSLTSTVSWM